MTRINGVHVAVLLREVQPVVTGEDGEAQAAPAHGLDPSRIEEVKSLVSRTVGIDENRGDTLIVSQPAFHFTRGRDLCDERQHRFVMV